MNGYTIGDKEKVDSYLKFSSSHSQKYHLVLPAEESNRLVITKDVNKLNRKVFLGITTHFSRRNVAKGMRERVNSIIIEGKKIINIVELDVSGNNIRSIPPEIKYLRGNNFDFRYNQITHLLIF